MSRDEQNQQRAAHILQAALQCFVERGFHQASMRDIAQAAGVSLGNLYNHIPGKQALILAAAELEQEALQPLLLQLQESEGRREQVQACLHAFDDLCREPQWAVLSVEVLAECARNPAVARAFANNRTRLQQALADALQALAQRERRRPALPATLQAQVLLDAIESAALRAGLGQMAETNAGSVDVLDPALLAALMGARG